MKLQNAPFRGYADELIAFRRPLSGIRDAEGKLYDADLYYAYCCIDEKDGIRFRFLACAREEPFEILSGDFDAWAGYHLMQNEELVPHPACEEEIREQYAGVIESLQKEYGASETVLRLRMIGLLDPYRVPGMPDYVDVPYAQEKKTVRIHLLGFYEGEPYGMCEELGRELSVVCYGETYRAEEKTF